MPFHNLPVPLIELRVPEAPDRFGNLPPGATVVLTAIMPQPISTPTAAGMIAPFVGTTDPTVAPMPRCTSGITAKWR